jgi:GR25 family glycosyltransferase involved in LPS biosynthesis/tetratricopeptide (TPR) repeat protein
MFFFFFDIKRKKMSDILNVCQKKTKKNMRRLCLVMIVKNERHVIQETFDSIITLIDCYCISDTGSTDGTPEFIRDYFEEKNIPGKVYHDTWYDFGTNRTLAFQHAFGRSEYAVVMDADDIVHGELKLPTHMNHDAYYLKFGGDGLQYARLQIFRNTLSWAYRGVLHEIPYCLSRETFSSCFIEGNYMIESRRLGNRNQNPCKYLRDAQQLEEALISESDESLSMRYLFYIGKSYFDFQDYKKAILYFKKRLEKKQNEEWYLSHFFIAQSYYALDKIVHKKDIISHYLYGHCCAPSRCECMYYLALFYQELKLYTRALNTLSCVKHLEPPKHTTQLIYADLYDYKCHLRYCELSDKEEEWMLFLQTKAKYITFFDVRCHPVLVRLLLNHTLTVCHVQEIVCDNQETRRYWNIGHDKNGIRLVVPMSTWIPCPDIEWTPLLEFLSTSSTCSRVYLTPGREVYGHESTSTHVPFLEKIDMKGSFVFWQEHVCLCLGLASFERGYTGLDKQCLVYCLSGHACLPDLLTSYFVYCLTQERNMGYRLSTQMLKHTVPLTGDWEDKTSFCDDMSIFKRVSYGNFCRLDWISFQHFSSFLTYLDIARNDETLVIDTLTPSDMSLTTLLEYERFCVRDYTHAYVPLCMVLYQCFSYPVEWSDFSASWSRLPWHMFSESIKNHIFPINQQMDIVLMENTQNRILHEMSLVRIVETSDDDHIVLRGDYMLSEGVMTWNTRFLDLRRTLTYFFPFQNVPWSCIPLSHDNTARLVHISNEKDVVLETYPLFVTLSKSHVNKVQDYVCFPHIRFLDSEVFFHPSTYMMGDAFQDEGFVKIFTDKKRFLYDSDYKGDFVHRRFFNDVSYIDEWGRRQLDFIHMTVPVFSENGIPVYCVNMRRRRDRRKRMEKELENVPFHFVDAIDGLTLQPTKECFHFYVGNYAGHRPGLLGCALSHLLLWEALIADMNHDYYIILEDDVRLTRVYCPNDVFANFYIVKKHLEELSSWDVVFLGYHRWDDRECVLSHDAMPLEWRPFNVNEYVGGTFGYIIHKKCAQFLLTVILEFGMFIAIDNIWHYYASFLDMYELGHDLVTSSWIRPHEKDGDSDIQRDRTELAYYKDDDFVVLENTVPDPLWCIIVKKEWKNKTDFAGYTKFSDVYMGFTSDGCVFGRKMSGEVRFIKKQGISSFIYRIKIMPESSIQVS